MRLVENTPGRLVLEHRALLTQAMILCVAAGFAALGLLILPVNLTLAVTFGASALLGLLLYLGFQARSRIAFDALERRVVIRRASPLRDNLRQMSLRDVAAAKVTEAGTLALCLTAAAGGATLPVMTVRVPPALVQVINDWLAEAALRDRLAPRWAG